MNSIDPSKANATISSSSNGEEKPYGAGKENGLMVPMSKRDRFIGTYRRQNFALPDSIMYYIAMNAATPKVYQSLVKTCKYFFIKNPIIVFTNAYLHEKLLHVDVNYFTKYHNAIDWTNCASKYWITNEFTKPGNVEDDTIISSIIPKFYRFDAKVLRLINLTITFDDYFYLSSAAEEIELNKVTVKDVNGSTILVLEQIFEISAKVKRFEFTSNTTLTNITAKTVKSLIENSKFSSLKLFSLNRIPETFDIEAFYVYMKKNKMTSFYLDFDATISDAYKARLAAINDEILGTSIFNYKPPLILFPGIPFEKYCNLQSVHRRHS